MTYSQQVQEQTQSYNRNLDNYFGSITDNYRTEVANAGRFGEDLQAIGAGLKTLSTKLDQRRTELKKKADVNYTNRVLEMYANGEIDINTDPDATPEDLSDRIKAVTEEIRNGMPLEWGTKFLNVDDYQNRVVQSALISAKTANAVDDIKQIVTDRGFDVSNSSAIAGSVAAARTEWVAANLAGFDNDLVIKNVPELLKKSTKVSEGYQKANNIRNSVRIENELTVAAQTGTMSVSDIYAKAALTYTDKGVPRNAAQVNTFVNNLYKNIASQGRFVGAARRNYVEHKPSWGGGKTLGELKEGFIAELDTDTSKAQKEQVGNFLRNRETAAALDAQADFQEYEDLVATGNRPNDDWVALKQQQYRAKHGEADVSLYNRMWTSREVTSEQALQEIDGKYGFNGLIYDDEPLLKYLTQQQKDQLASRIQPSQAKQAQSKIEGNAVKIIDGELSANDKLRGSKPGFFSSRGEWIKQQAKRDFQDLFAEGKRMGLNDDQAYDRAIKTIKPEIKLGGKYDTYNTPYVDDLADRQFTEQTTRWFGMNPNRLPEAGEFEVPQAMLDYINKFEKGLIPNPTQLENISDRIPGVGPMDVAESFKAAAGEPFKLPKEEEAARSLGNLFPESRPLWKFPSPANTDQLGVQFGAYEHMSFNSPEVTHEAVQGRLQDDFGERMFVSIGLNEGTRTNDGGFTEAYRGHTDPGDQMRNRGTISASEGTPEEADKKWRGILSKTRREYKNVLVNMGIPIGSRNYQVMMFNILDLRVQAPAAVPDFVKQIPQIVAAGVSAETVGRARHDAYIDPRTGNLSTTFNVSPDNPRYSVDLLVDQMNRSMTILDNQRGSYTRERITNTI